MAPEFSNSKNVIILNKKLFDLQNFSGFSLLITHMRKKLLIKQKMGVTKAFFELNKFKRKLTTILKRHYCHSNHSYALFRSSF